MAVLVLSCGRTGTNMLLESLRGSSHLKATEVAEHKQLYRVNPELGYDPTITGHANPSLPLNYLSKSDTVYIDNFQQVKAVMDKNDHLKILWTIRDLRDASLSKICRGQPGTDTPILSDDATLKGCVEDIDWMAKIYRFILAHYPDRIMLVKMEDVICNFEDTLKKVCKFCEVPYEDAMTEFVGRYRLKTKASRYKTLDKGQLETHKRVFDIYDGFYKTHPINIGTLFSQVTPYLEIFGYGR